jgi:hypothetical protein
MQQQDDTQQAAELRLAFLRHLPKRLEMLRKRGQRLCDQGWDINALTLLFREVQTAGRRLRALRVCWTSASTCSRSSVSLRRSSRRSAFPMPGKRQRSRRGCAPLEPLIASLGAASAEERARRAPPRCATTKERVDFPLWVTPPPDYWHRFVRNAAHAPARPVPAADARRRNPPRFRSRPRRPRLPLRLQRRQHAGPSSPRPHRQRRRPRRPRRPHSRHARLAAPNRPTMSAAAPRARSEEQRKVYHLSDGNPLASELDQKLDTIGGY